MSETIDCRYLVVGGGLTGLACAATLQRAGADWALWERNDVLGGRVSTDRSHSGYLIDRGFQVLNTAYPALERLVDVEALYLGTFAPGAEVQIEGKFHRIGDPLRRPVDLLGTLDAPVGSLRDKTRILELISFCRNPANHRSCDGMSTEEFLNHFGFTPRMIERFFRPFFGGVFLEEELATTAKKFVTLFSYFSSGLASLPKKGMQALPEQIAESLPQERLFTGNRLVKWTKNGLESENLKGKPEQVILANWCAATQFLETPKPAFHSACTLAFSAPKGSVKSSSFLQLNGEPSGSVQTVAFNSHVQPSYAPADRNLLVVSCRGESSAGQVTEELIGWYGDGVKSWEHLKTDRIEQALPVEHTSFSGPLVTEHKGVRTVVCGDHTETGSIQGALTSGRKAAQLVLEK